MSFQTDVDADRAAVFFDAAGSGFAVSITHTAARTGVATAVNNAVAEEMTFAYDSQQDVKLRWSAAGPTPNAGDRVTHAGFTWHVRYAIEEDGVWTVLLFRQDERQ